MNDATQFASFELPLNLKKAIDQMGFTTPTPVQAQSIPQALQGKDIISIAETGSGKTAAFLIPTIARLIKASVGNPEIPDQKLREPGDKFILVLTPTRELAQQVIEVAKQLTQFSPSFEIALLIGGDHMGRQVQNLRREPDMIVATPGRLMDHYRRRTINMNLLGALIIDEADRMFDMGFAPQVQEIVEAIPAERQTMLFSATFPPEVKSLAQKILKNPVNLSVEKSIQAPSQIVQKILNIQSDKKEDTTLDLVNAAKGSVLIFARTKQRTDKLADYLESYGVQVARIHGDRSQGQRNQAIRGFRSGFFRVLVATDIAARGIDVPSVSDVINFDIPESHEDYIHRIGRTGRAGREGQAMTLVTNGDKFRWTAMARKLGLAAPAQPRMSGSHPRGMNTTSQPRENSKGLSAHQPRENNRALRTERPLREGIRDRRDRPQREGFRSSGFGSAEPRSSGRPSFAAPSSKPAFRSEKPFQRKNASAEEQSSDRKPTRRLYRGEPAKVGAETRKPRASSKVSGKTSFAKPGVGNDSWLSRKSAGTQPSRF